MLCILKAIIAWIILTLIGTNLIGFLVRGIACLLPFVNALIDPETDEVLRDAHRSTVIGGLTMTFLEILVIAAYLFSLFHFWNVWLALAGVTVMVLRIPDLIWEIRTGLRVTRTRFPKGPVYSIARALWWGSLLLIWYSFC